MANQKFTGHRVGNHGAWNARAYVQDASQLSPRLLAWLQADPRRVDEFRWKDGVRPKFAGKDEVGMMNDEGQCQQVSAPGFKT